MFLPFGGDYDTVRYRGSVNYWVSYVNGLTYFPRWCHMAVIILMWWAGNWKLGSDCHRQSVSEPGCLDSSAWTCDSWYRFRVHVQRWPCVAKRMCLSWHGACREGILCLWWHGVCAEGTLCLRLPSVCAEGTLYLWWCGAASLVLRRLSIPTGSCLPFRSSALCPLHFLFQWFV